mmetsp:Transcript_32794/g.59180  ORF Transcript_32794/g.59180 Transcript_32794/m.59180 type:complete len:199 (-) Transcript_32794:92-688(-)
MKSKGLKKLGVSEDDVNLAGKLLEQIPACPSDPNKAERIFGYASSRLARDKALRLLGTTEEEVDKDAAKTLGSLGVAGRRRSFSVMAQHHPNHSEMLAFTNAIPKARARASMAATMTMHRSAGRGSILRRRHTSNVIKREVRRKSSIDKRIRRSDSEIRIFHNQTKEANEIGALRAKIDVLEKRLAGTAVQRSDKMVH